MKCDFCDKESGMYISEIESTGELPTPPFKRFNDYLNGMREVLDRTRFKQIGFCADCFNANPPESVVYSIFEGYNIKKGVLAKNMRSVGTVTDRSWCDLVGDNYLDIIDAPKNRRRIYSDEVPMSDLRVIYGGMRTFYFKGGRT